MRRDPITRLLGARARVDDRVDGDVLAPFDHPASALQRVGLLGGQVVTPVPQHALGVVKIGQCVGDVVGGGTGVRAGHDQEGRGAVVIGQHVDGETWPEAPPALQERWGVLPSPGPIYVIAVDFSGQPSPVYGVIVVNTSETWTYGRWEGDSATGPDISCPLDSCASSPDTSQPYPLDDLIKRIDDVTEGGT